MGLHACRAHSATELSLRSRLTSSRRSWFVRATIAVECSEGRQFILFHVANGKEVAGPHIRNVSPLLENSSQPTAVA